MFIEKPLLRAGVRFHLSRDADDQDVIVLTGAEPFFVNRSVFEKLVPLLTGQHTSSQIAKMLKGELSALEVVASIQTLAKHHAVIDATSAQDRDEEETAASRGAVFVRRIGQASVEVFPRILTDAGFTVTHVAEEANLSVVVTDHYLRDELAELNRSQTKPWLLLRPYGREMWIGPLIVPGETACWECLAHRLRFNSKVEQFVASEAGEFPFVHTAAVEQPSSARNVVFAIAAQIARDWISGERSGPLNTLFAVDPASMGVTRHITVRRPQCPACGTDEIAALKPIYLQDRLSSPSHPWGGQNTAQSTLDRYGYHISPITGLAPQLVNTSSVPDIHVYGGGAYSSRRPRTQKALLDTLHYRASGKGLTETAAKASALAETLEWYTLDAQPAAALETDSYERLSGRARVIPPPALCHFSAAQFADREAINRMAGEAKYFVPELFDPVREIGWLKVWSLAKRDWAFVPGGACCPSYACPFMKGNSNGNAAGATLEQAMLHGALEAIERDAVALWWYNCAAAWKKDPLTG